MPRKTPRTCKGFNGRKCGKFLTEDRRRSPRCFQCQCAKNAADKRKWSQDARKRAREAVGPPETPQAYPKPVKQTDPAYRAWVRKQGCILKHLRNTGECRSQPGRAWVEFAHIKTRGARGSDWGNGVGMCPFHHDQQGVWGIQTFQVFHGLDLHQIAQDLARAYKRESWPE